MNSSQICLLKMSQGDPKPDKSLNAGIGMNSKRPDMHVEWLLCQDQMNISLITASQTGPGVADGQPRLEHLKCLICFSGEKPGDPCSSSLSFRVVRLEAVCSSPRLFTAGGIHSEETHKGHSVWTAGSYSEPVFTCSTLWTISLQKRGLWKAVLLTNLCFVST